MKILFLTLLDIKDLNDSNLYTDLMRTFIENGDTVNVVCPTGGAYAEDTHYIDLGCDNGILRVKTEAVQKVSFIKKGIATLSIEPRFKGAIKRFLSKKQFDTVIYSTPPITFAGVVSFVKKKYHAKSYLLLKDIFPQNAVDIGIMSKTGVKSIIYKFFRLKEKKLYKISDYIGCMSKANVDFVLKNNPFVDKNKVHINPNSIKVCEKEITAQEKLSKKEKYGIPQDATAFIYGGNLGKPQGIPFITECIKAIACRRDVFLAICGTGTEYSRLEAFVNKLGAKNVKLINGMPKEQYEDFASCFDVGLIFLDHRFTIPNFPSRLLSYMQNKMPVIACTDVNSDIGEIIENGNFGWWCESNSVEGFEAAVNKAINADLASLGNNSFEYLKEHFNCDKSYEIIKGITK